MYKSSVVKLVFLNSVLALSGCSRSCEDIDDGQVPGNGQPRTSCHGRARSHVGTGVHFVPIPVGGTGVGSPPSGARPGSGTVSRGGFGSTGTSAVS